MQSIRLLLATSCLIAIPFGQASAQTSAAPKSTTGKGATETGAEPAPVPLDEIIVTASRRSESIRKVPTAVSAFSGASLREQQITSLSDLAALTPNVQISTYLTNANINIRGVGNGNFIQAGGDPGVAVHADGVYLGQSALALSTFLDVERVEVLRGPQGTLFGRNATGGAVNIIARRPTTVLSVGAEVTAGIDPALVRSAGYVSGPLDGSGRFLVRLSAEQNYNAGYTRNRGPGGPSRLDGTNDFAMRGQFEWHATDDLSFRLLAEYAQNRDGGPAAYLLGTPNGGPIVFPDPINPIVLPPNYPVGDPTTRTAYANVGQRSMDAATINLNVDWALGGGDLKLLLSHNENHNRIAQDGDGTATPFTATFFTNRANQEYGELIFSSEAARPFSYVLGGNFYDEHLTQNDVIPTSGYILLFPPYTAGGTVDTRSYGVFGRAEWRVRPSTKIFGGVRYSHDRKRQSEYFNLRPIFTGGLPVNNSGAKSWGRVSYEFGLSQDFGSRVTGYAKYATGYKSGGYSVSSFNPAFDPETNSNIEVGLKGTALGGVLQANLSAFHMKYKNLQVTQVQGLVSAVTNAARATVDGVELESVLRPVAGLRIEGNASWLRARFDDFTTLDSSRPALGPLNLTGNTLPNAPRLSGSLGAFYDVRVGGGTVTPGARYAWRDKLYFSEFNLPISSQRAIGTLDFYLNYKGGDGRWTASLFARNVTNRAIKANVVVVSALLGSLAIGQYQPGRQIGASIGFHF